MNGRALCASDKHKCPYIYYEYLVSWRECIRAPPLFDTLINTTSQTPHTKLLSCSSLLSLIDRFCTYIIIISTIHEVYISYFRVLT